MKFFLLLLIFLLINPNCFATEEIITSADNVFTSADSVFTAQTEIESLNPEQNELTFREKIEKIKSEEITDTGKPAYLLEDILTKELKGSPIETIQLFGFYRAGLSMDFEPSDNDLTYNFNEIHAGIKGKFRGSDTFYMAKLRLTPQNRYNFIQFLPSDLYISNKTIPHHTLYLGNVRTPVGFEGSKGISTIPFALRSQISRNFSNVRKLGVKIEGDYDLVEYSFGGFSSDTYFRKFFPGTEFSARATLKPLGKTDGKYGNLQIGGTVSAGKNDIDYFVSGAYLCYKYKNFFTDFEWAKADGYNGYTNISSNHAEGFYTTVGYNITPKVQILGRYDQYTPNLNNSADIRREYSCGINYFIKGQALKLILNYVFCQNDAFKDSHRILLGTQIAL